MKNLSLLCVVILIFVTPSQAATHLSDDIGGKTFESSGNPYMVDQDVVIPKNTQTVIKAGCVFLFKSFTGINIYGSMLVEGTVENPVIFSSINDANYNPEASQLPNAFDWNGIYISEESGDIKFRNFKLMYSVFGIKSKKDEITLQNGNFKQNGQFHFTINDNIHYVQDNISYSYNIEEKKESSEQPRKKVTSDMEKKPKKKEKSKKERGRRIAAVSLLSVGVASGVTFLITGIKTIQYKNDMENASSDDEWNSLNDKFKVTKSISIISGITSGVTLPLSLFLFVKKDKSTMTKKVSLNINAGREKVGIGFSRYF